MDGGVLEGEGMRADASVGHGDAAKRVARSLSHRKVKKHEFLRDGRRVGGNLGPRQSRMPGPGVHIPRAKHPGCQPRPTLERKASTWRRARPAAWMSRSMASESVTG